MKSIIENNNVLIRNTVKDLIGLLVQECFQPSFTKIKIMGAFDFRDNFKEIGEIYQVSGIGNNVEIRILLDKKQIVIKNITINLHEADK